VILGQAARAIASVAVTAQLTVRLKLAVAVLLFASVTVPRVGGNVLYTGHCLRPLRATIWFFLTFGDD
jgi:hypothetical protein